MAGHTENGKYHPHSHGGRHRGTGKIWWEDQKPVHQEQILLASGVHPAHKGLSWQNLGQENQAKIKREYLEAR